jgi:hypothetical protein
MNELADQPADCGKERGEDCGGNRNSQLPSPIEPGLPLLPLSIFFPQRFLAPLVVFTLLLLKSLSILPLSLLKLTVVLTLFVLEAALFFAVLLLELQEFLLHNDLMVLFRAVTLSPLRKPGTRPIFVDDM